MRSRREAREDGMNRKDIDAGTLRGWLEDGGEVTLVVGLNQSGKQPARDPTELEAGANRRAAG